MMDADITYSHGLLTCAALAALLSVVFFARRRDRIVAWIIAALVMSHWLLDFVSHPPDMPLAPGLPWRFGLGLWSSISATLAVEGSIWVIAIFLYVRATRTSGWLSTCVFWSGIVLLTLSWLSNIASPPPADLFIAMLSSFLFFVVTVAWGYWVNLLRPARIHQKAEEGAYADR
jgi:hypothetical protein